MNHFLAYDVGTSSVKAILCDENGKIYATALAAYPLFTPQAGWVEQDPIDYWTAICQATHSMIGESNVPINTIKGISFSTQAMGIIPIDKNGTVLHRNISWVDGRAEKQARKMMRKLGGKTFFKALIGIEMTGKDVIPKLMWFKENKADLFAKTYKILDVNGYLKFKCTGKMVAEWSGACSYGFDLKKKDWERWLFRYMGISPQKLPDLVRSTDLVGTLTDEAAQSMGLVAGIPIFGGCDDTQSAAIGTTAIANEEAHIYLGTSAWVGITSDKVHGFKHGAVCLQSADPAKNLVVCITESAGANTEWLLNEFYTHEKATLTTDDLFTLLEKDIKNIPAGSAHLLVTPWFLGERCPVSTTTTRSTIFNLTHQHHRAHIARAHFEGIAYNLRWAIEQLERDFGFVVRQIKVTGGGSYNKTWLQIIADITERPIIATSQPKNAGALGAAMCALVGSRTLISFDQVQQLVQSTATFQPNPAHQSIYRKMFKMYQTLYHALKVPYKTINQEIFELNQGG